MVREAEEDEEESAESSGGGAGRLGAESADAVSRSVSRSSGIV